METKVEKSQAKRRRIPIPAKVAIVWIGVYLLLKFFKPPLPSSIIFMYMATVTVGLALAVSIYEHTLQGFKGPIVWFLRGDAARAWPWRAARWALLVTIPAYVGYGVYQRVVPRFEPPIASRVIHPAPPPEVAALYNSLRDDEANLKRYIEEGSVIYFQNCFFCHGAALEGKGHFAHGMNPPPSDFQDSGTIAQLTESFVFWRISTGGPGLPDESMPWNSFMPRWETMLTDEEMWKVILYLYDTTGWSPRTWGKAEGAMGEFEHVEEVPETVAEGPKTLDGVVASRRNYGKYCASCHGAKGEGDGPAEEFMVPRPRNFTWGLYKFRSTPSGDSPTDEDLIRSIRHGIPGTAMPGWDRFTDAELKALVDYIKAFSEEGFEYPGEAIKIGKAPQASPELIERGKKVYQDTKCWECHGQVGRGDGKKAREPKFKDDWGHRIFARNLTHPWEYRSGAGAAVEDIYRSIATGLDGTPMASFQDSLSDEDLWALAHYVRFLQTQRKLGHTLVAKRIEKIPSDPEDPLWDRVDYLDIPMVGQVIVEPRMFTPRVDNVRVQAVYNDKDVAFRLVWDDSTETKPDPAREIFKDAVAVQFPVAVPTGPKRPYFLMGDGENPVYLWRWSSERSDAIELNAKGANQIQAQSESGQQVTAKLKYDDGQYRLVFKRDLSTPDRDFDIQFAPGQFIPMAFFAWDGTNNETGVRFSHSSWYNLLLEPTTPATIYLYPFIAILLMGGAEWWFIGRNRKNKGVGA
ncbi:MAG: c-type cytochrome [Acidiferrobacterales bacterium]